MERPKDNQDGGLALSVGGLRVFPQLRAVLRGDKKIEIGAKALDVLLALIAADGQIVSKDDLLSRVWPGQVVEENSLQAQISALRRVLGPNRGLLTTVFGRGYRLDVSPAPAPDTAKEPGTNRPSPDIPIALSPLLGRQNELADLCGSVKAGALVTLTGSGGIGKTRLSIEVGHQLSGAFESGVRFVTLASLTNPDLVFPTIASKLQIDIGFGHVAADDRSKLRNLRLLLILDNCEHVLEAVARTVSHLLETAPGLAILATSQEPLGIEGEQVCRLQPLDLPPENTATLADAIAHASAALLVQRAKDADRTYRLGDDQAADICKICRRLDGIPLAIELAAARIPLIGLQAVVSGLSDRFKLLTAGRRTAIPRHQTLRATLEWSYGLLNAGEQQLLSRLGIFAGPFTLEAVCAVAAPELDDQWAATDLIADLVKKSLITKDLDCTANRFQLLESARAFALEKLALAGEFPDAAARHSAYFRSHLTEAAQDWRTLSSERWLAEYRDDLSDVRAALDWTLSNESDPHQGARALCSSLPFWMQMSLLDECRGRVETALVELSAGLGNEPDLEMRLHSALGASLAWVKGPTPAAHAAWARSLDLARHLNNAEYLIQAHYGLWLYNLRSGHYECSLSHASQLREAGVAHGDVGARQAGERASGVSLHFMGRHAEAVVLIEMMLKKPDDQTDRSFPFRFGIDQNVAGLAYLARILWVLGDKDHAISVASMAVREAEALGHASSLCCALLEGACTVAALSGDMNLLVEWSALALKVSEDHGLGFWRLYANAFICLADARLQPSMMAVERLKAASAALCQINLDPGYSVFQHNLARMLDAVGLSAEAAAVINELTSRAGMEAHWGAAEFLRIKAELNTSATNRGSSERRRCLKQALAIARSQGANSWESNISQQLNALV